MRKKIESLEKIATQLHVKQPTRTDWNLKVVAYADQFLKNISTAKTFNASDETGEGLLDFPVSEEPQKMEKLLEIIKDHIDTPALNAASGGHLAYIPGGGIFPTALGDYLADITNNYAGIFFASPGAVRMENLLIRWMCALIGFPETALGNLTSGGSIANLIAITAARDRKKIRSRDVEHSVIYLTSQAHHSLQKAIRIAGLNEAILSYIPTDDKYRMRVEVLHEQVRKDIVTGRKPFLIIASAGTTDVGAIDPLAEIGAIAKQYDLWYHIDAAYGGFFLLSDEVKHKLSGIEKADSVTIDPHKGMFLAYGTGAVLIKDIEAIKHSHYYFANYMQDAKLKEEEPNPADLSPELTKHFRGMRMWLPLQLFGLKPFKAALTEKVLLCQYFYEAIKKLGFETGPYPDLSVAIYRYIPEDKNINEFNAQLVEAVRQDGKVFLSSTTINGIFWIRLAVLCFRTHLYHIDLALEILATKVNELLEKKN